MSWLLAGLRVLGWTLVSCAGANAAAPTIGVAARVGGHLAHGDVQLESRADAEAWLARSEGELTEAARATLREAIDATDFARQRLWVEGGYAPALPTGARVREGQVEILLPRWCGGGAAPPPAAVVLRLPRSPSAVTRAVVGRPCTEADLTRP